MTDEPDYKTMWELTREENRRLVAENSAQKQEIDALKAEIKRLTGIEYSPPVV